MAFRFPGWPSALVSVPASTGPAFTVPEVPGDGSALVSVPASTGPAFTVPEVPGGWLRPGERAHLDRSKA
jgi:hypothetical protein